MILPNLNSDIPGGDADADLILPPAPLFALKEILAESSAIDATSFSTTSALFRPGALVVAFIFSRKGNTAHSAPVSLKSSGRTWTQVTDAGRNTCHLSVWHSYAEATTSGPVVIDYNALTIESITWSFVEIIGAQGLSPIAQSVAMANDSADTNTTTLPSQPNANSLSLGCVGLASRPSTVFEDADFNALSVIEDTPPGLKSSAGFGVGQVSRTVTWTGAETGASALVEILAASTSAAAPEIEPEDGDYVVTSDGDSVITSGGDRIVY